MELPDVCPNCRHENMVNWENLESRPLDKLYTIEGYSCKHCAFWKPCFYLTRQLDEGIQRLVEMPFTHRSFHYHFVKTIKRAQEIQLRGRKVNGKLSTPNLAPT